MTSSPAALAPALPESIAEWEDLLVRMEIMTRALRNTLETLSLDDPGARAVLREAVERERRVNAWLEEVSLGDASPAAAAPGEAEADARWLADRFASLRARSFAMVQRRGLEVWEWAADFGPNGPVSTYQLLVWLVRHDVRALAALRERSRAC